MYGIIIDSLMDSIKNDYSENIWTKVVASPEICTNVFTTHKIYDEDLIAIIVKETSRITGVSSDVIMESAGEHFLVYIKDIGNDSITNVLGRTFKDFLAGLNCMHEYYRFSFTEMQPPSFNISQEDENGLELHYRSRRNFLGLMYYVRGLLKKIAIKFYAMDIDIQITHQGFTGDVMLVVYRINYKNEEFEQMHQLIMEKRMFRRNNNLILPSNRLFDLFPFHVVFDERLVILSTGNGLDSICGELEGLRLTDCFFMTRPLGYELTWDNILIHRSNVFELTSVKSSGQQTKTDISRIRDQMTATHFTKLRGQMLYIKEGSFVIFLASFMIDDLNNMGDIGMFVNDLPLHDLSRDLVMHAPRQTSEYKLALDLEQGKAARFEEVLENLTSEQRKTNDLLYSMIPKEVASSIRQGNYSINQCQKYSDVTVLFSDVVNFANICKHIAPHEVMITLNMMVSVFDILCEKFNTYKVETVADGFMCVSGAPQYDEEHAHNMADMSLAMLRGIKTVRDPNTREPIQIRIGLHCGPVVAGLIGQKIPQYCLFGDTVNIASKLEATGSGQRIQISQTCMEKLIQSEVYDIEDKGIVKIKGRQKIMTYWLNGYSELPFSCLDFVERHLAISRIRIKSSRKQDKDTLNTLPLASSTGFPSYARKISDDITNYNRDDYFIGGVDHDIIIYEDSLALDSDQNEEEEIITTQAPEINQTEPVISVPLPTEK